ncbi:MAG: MerR family transcriptional regulator [Actinomycetota bacterium]|nr:MerR family transcriptional regulator [Actinomycetota bacterium]
MRPEQATRPGDFQTDEVLSIGQLAAHVGVTVRAIRHYHKVGLLAEPGRDTSGYRRYGARAAADLIRIKALADAGVPLSRIRQLLDADPDDFAEAIAEIDQRLAERISELEDLRRQLAGLKAAERSVLPAEVTRLLDQMRSLGVSEATMTFERDGWTLLMTLSPEQAAKSASEKSAALADPVFQQLYLRWDQARDWDPDDPRLADLAVQTSAWLEEQSSGPPPADPPAGIATVSALLSAQLRGDSPAWRRLDELSRQSRRPVADRRGKAMKLPASSSGR